jgi:2-keto-4-pentenoate hydratase
MDRVTAAADFLAELRRTRSVAPALPETCRPVEASEAYAVQAALVERLLAPSHGHAVGYKVACTNKLAQDLLRVDGPFCGRLLSPTVYAAPARLPAGDFVHRILEAEFAFEMADTVPAAAEPYTAESIAPFVAAILPAIEIVDWHYVDWTAAGALSLIADNAIHGAWIVGEPYAAWRDLDLATHDVRLIVNGQVITQGNGAAVLGHPLNVMAWLANELPKYGGALKAGDRISTGVCTDVYEGKAGDSVRADFGVLGGIDLVFD